MTSLQYIIKFYRAKTRLLLLSVLCLFCCYASVALIFTFASLVEQRTSAAFNSHFAGARYILSGPAGIVFSSGRLQCSKPVKTALSGSLSAAFPSTVFKIVKCDAGNADAYIQLNTALPQQALAAYCNHHKIKMLSGFTKTDSLSAYDGYLYDLNNHQNKFSIFSFGNQLSAAVLGTETSSAIGGFAKLIFFSAVLLTFYMTLLYFRERKTEAAVFIIQGYIDTNLKITMIDSCIQNLFAFLLTIACVPLILKAVSASPQEISAVSGGLIYIIPYLPLITIVQILVLLNQSLSYAAKFR